MKSLTISFISALLIGGLALPVQAEFNQRWYLGLGGGASFMTPNVNGTGFVNDEEGDTAYKVYLGWDFARKWAVEAQFADLGEATVVQGPGQMLTPPEAAVAYEALGLSVLYHIYNSQGNAGYLDRTGFALFGKLGVGMLDTSSDDVEIEQLEDAHVLLGLGLEYEFESGLAIRAEYEAFDEDAQLASLGLLWRFGGGRGSSAIAAAAPAPERESVTETVEETASQPAAGVDSDSDGVQDVLDACPATAPGSAVDSQGGPVVSNIRDGVLAGVEFESGSSTLTAQAQQLLDETASDMLRSPTVRIAIMAHTDNQGAAAGNLELSKQRALAVARYLVSRGVEGSRLQPEAYGESRPLVSNGTAEGRTQNRRIELRRLN